MSIEENNKVQHYTKSGINEQNNQTLILSKSSSISIKNIEEIQTIKEKIETVTKHLDPIFQKR